MVLAPVGGRVSDALSRRWGGQRGRRLAPIVGLVLSAVVTVINLTSSLYDHPSGKQSAGGSNADNTSPKSYGPPYARRQGRSRRQFSFVPGDCPESRLKGLAAPARQNVQNRPAILSKPLAYNAERSSHMISPTHVYAKTQELQERRSGSNSLMTSNGRMEIFGPPDQLNGT